MTDMTNAPLLPDAMKVDEDARWVEIQKISKRVAYQDGSPTEVESALCGAVIRVDTLRAQLSEQTARADACEKDAKRYRWLRENRDSKEVSVVFKIGDDKFDYATAKHEHTFDCAVDAAIGPAT